MVSENIDPGAHIVQSPVRRRRSLAWRSSGCAERPTLSADGVVLGYRIEAPAAVGESAQVSLLLHGEEIGTLVYGSAAEARKVCVAYERALRAAHKDAMAYLFVRLRHHLNTARRRQRRLKNRLAERQPASDPVT